MKRTWLIVGSISVLGLIAMGTYAGVSISKQIEYEVLGYQVQLLDAVGVTFRVNFSINNPTRFNVDVSQQRYSVFVAGYRISEITAKNAYRLLADNVSAFPLDVYMKWEDIQNKVSPMISQSTITTLGELPVLIQGTLTAKAGFLKISSIPFRTRMLLSDFLP